ncbi:xylulokinase [Sulfidibacter corallicola]|uniref:Xylulose kinase n=1 Tax=Sulfidibacter corallicola TaxID=2818388 RepID=A0A8A4TJJ4_SULCO|nr:xylulokinase [Sulfidibacter corallicola]QTD49720.1 xylulokinase [Sulfidibacter corallicola]
MSTVLGIDLGTQSLKVVFYDGDLRRVVASESAPLSLDQDGSGRAEQRVAWWVEGLHKAMLAVDPEIRRSATAIGVSGQQHGLVALDRDGHALFPVKLWCDTTCAAECDEIMANLGGEAACIDKLGNPILPGYTAGKIRWFRKYDPENYARMVRVLLPHDYLNFYLTGQAGMEFGDASGTGFFDVRRRAWSDEVLRAIDPDRDLRDCLPPLFLSDEPIGTLRASVAQQLGLPAGIPVSVGGGDNMMGAIGTGNVVPGTITMSLGTSGTLYAFSDQPRVDPEGRIAAFCSSNDGWLPLLCTMNCTVSTEWMRRLFSLDIDAFEAHIAKADCGAGGVLTLPFFHGERTPNLPKAKGCLLGLDGDNGKPENLLRSAVEGATFSLFAGIEILTSLGCSTREIVLTGGGARSATWRQIVADIGNLPVTVLDQSEGAAMGAALQALGLLAGVRGDAFAALVRDHLSRNEPLCCTPNDSAVDIYRDLFAEYRKAVALAIDLYR